MTAVVVYESMYGNTRIIAEAVASGLGDAEAIPVARAVAEPDRIRQASLVVVGGPTHAFGMSRPSTRQSAAQAAGKPGSTRSLEDGATGPGLREWLAGLDGENTGPATAFDTRVPNAGIAGHAAPRIARMLRRRGIDLLCKPRSFFVTREDKLVAGQLESARQWGAELAERAHLPHPTR